MGSTLSRQAKEILVMSAENPAHRRCPLQVVAIVVAQEVQVASRDGVDPGTEELPSYLRRYIFVEIEANLAQKVVQRP
jgi:hypothetical protein